MIDRELVVKEITDRLAEVIDDAETSDFSEDRNLGEFASFDSLGILETLVWLEDRFDVSIPDEDLIVEHFNSIRKMADYVVRIKV